SEQIDAVRCSESPNPRDPRRYPALETFSYNRAGDVGRLVAWSTEVCATWPARAENPYTGPWHRITAHPILVINNIYDPAAPFPAGTGQAREPGGPPPAHRRGLRTHRAGEPEQLRPRVREPLPHRWYPSPERSHLPTGHPPVCHPQPLEREGGELCLYQSSFYA